MFRGRDVWLSENMDRWFGGTARPTEDIAIELADRVLDRPRQHKPERLFSLWLFGMKLTPEEAEIVSRFMDERGLGPDRPEPGVSYRVTKALRREKTRLAKEERAQYEREEVAESPALAEFSRLLGLWRPKLPKMQPQSKAKPKPKAKRRRRPRRPAA